jgi:4a-hydroxytetrahydrobiopterin dehydratase
MLRKQFRKLDYRARRQFLKEWKLTGDSIEKNFKFKDFKEAIRFINRVADIAESENHHPDILLWSWNNVKLTLTTHTAKGLSEKDFSLASKIDEQTGSK